MEIKGLAEALPPLSRQEALVESNRCLFCYDAPCIHACPTHIDIPGFIKKIATGNLTGSARVIFDSNLMGATCARVCPVQELCEGACVLGQEHRPIMIGRLQRYAMDHAYTNGGPQIPKAAATGRKVAVVGAGPAGLSCAGELARRGHSVTVFEKRSLGGGLSTYGIISLREPVEASLKEVTMIERLGVKILTGRELGRDIAIDELQHDYDAVFLGTGLGSTTQEMEIPGEELIVDGLDYIEASKLDPVGMKVGRNVTVIGAGNTAIDCATVAKRLGAGTVTMLYRRTAEEMTAYPHEFDFIKKEGVIVSFLTQPVRVLSENGSVTGLECVRMELGSADASGRRTAVPVKGSEFVLSTDQVVKAVGQQKPVVEGLKMERGFISVNAEFETSVKGLFAGGDCIRGKGSASTVMAVQDGKLAAAAIHAKISARWPVAGDQFKRTHGGSED